MCRWSYYFPSNHEQASPVIQKVGPMCSKFQNIKMWTLRNESISGGLTVYKNSGHFI